MLILQPYEPLVLPQVPKFEWRTPSAAQAKDQGGNENQTRFRVRLMLNDGHVKWVGWFDDRDDWDAYLHAIVLQIDQSIPIPVPLRNLIIEEYGDPSWWPGLVYDFATVTFLTASPGGNLTYTRPVDWSNANNTCDTIGGGGSGACAGLGAIAGSPGLTGGGGGAWNRTSNVTLGATATYRIGSGALAVANSGPANSASQGLAGGDSWFNGATLGASSVGSKAGGAGATGTVTQNGGPGGVAASGVGAGHDGGRGGQATASANNTGGGGAGGQTAAGVNGVDTPGVSGAGGAGDGGSGGAASAGASGASNGNSSTSAGGIGTEYDGSHGSGGGSGSDTTFGNTSGNATSGPGGLYGAGSGAAYQRTALGASHGTSTSGAGAQGMIVITYTPGLAIPIFRDRSLRFFRTLH